MNRTIIGAAVAAALAMTGLSAHASCVDARTAGQQAAAHAMPEAVLRSLVPVVAARSGLAAQNIVGTWHVVYTVEGAPFGEAFIQWHADGTEWENINLPILGGNVCMGDWKAIDVSHVFRNHIGWLYTNGMLSGYFTETETDLVSRDGNSYTGTNEQKVFDLTGKMLADVTGTSSAKRIAP